MLRDVGFGDGAYVLLQRMGSQSVHGTWADLVDNYLDAQVDPMHFDVRDNSVSPRVPLFTSTALHVNRFIVHAVWWMLSPYAERTAFFDRLRIVERKLVDVAHADRPGDFGAPQNSEV